MLRVALTLTIAFLAIWVSPVADAHCHAFSITATSPVTEGQKTTVTVTRDGNVKPSSVHVQTVDGTAKGISDYGQYNAQVSFTTETSKTFTLPIVDDKVPEGTESFSIKLSGAQGCDGSGYVYGSPAVVTIKDNDAIMKTPAPTAAPTAAPTRAPAVVTTPTRSPSPTATPSTTPTATPTPTPLGSPLAAPENTSGVSPWLVGGAIAGVLAASAGALLLYRMRRV